MDNKHTLRHAALAQAPGNAGTILANPMYNNLSSALPPSDINHYSDIRYALPAKVARLLGQALEHDASVVQLLVEESPGDDTLRTASINLLTVNELLLTLLTDSVLSPVDEEETSVLPSLATLQHRYASAQVFVAKLIEYERQRTRTVPSSIPNIVLTHAMKQLETAVSQLITALLKAQDEQIIRLTHNPEEAQAQLIACHHQISGAYESGRQLLVREHFNFQLWYDYGKEVQGQRSKLLARLKDHIDPRGAHHDEEDHDVD